ncbi:hypothetical protein [Amycolatopsis sp. RTGN1]|uniref:hypothetical protein n=1 Tax=Amycolatopsis ponsaeliensis TaxID=2992142 RepID=UPI00254AC36D|nr:hypothetical protein [Amycolatopsis sp. RTGN1]
MPSSVLKRSLVTVAGLALAVTGGLAATTTAAQASTTGADSTEQVEAGPFSLPYQGSNADVPTWLFGPTTICVQNVGNGSGAAHLVGRAGGETYLFPGPHGIACASWWGWGVPVNVQNVWASPLAAWSS